jgi:hypothetical protein
MPIHDWTRVTARTWHDFLLAWFAELAFAPRTAAAPAPREFGKLITRA